MKRISLVLIALFIFGNTYSQDLLKHVPKSSIYVFAINGNNLDQKMSLKELEKLPFFQSGMKEMFNKKRSSDDINFESAGVALNSPSYLFVQLSDSMTYVGYVMKLSNANLFETFILRDQKGEIELEKSDNGISTIAKRSRMIAWNNEMAVFMSGNANYNYFRELERERTEEMELELKKEIEEALKETGGKEPEVIIEEVQPIEEPDQPQPVEIVEEVVIDEEIVEELRSRAKAIVTAEEKKSQPAEDLLTMPGMDEGLAYLLASHDIKTMEDLAELSVDDLLEIDDTMSKERASKLIMTAREPWFK